MPQGNSYETVVGLEVHVQLNTMTKMFCSCPAAFGSPQNTNVCPVCLGLPGALPVVNREAVERGMVAALALGCEVRPSMKFDRKSYYYPDLPKNYQISQYEAPLGHGGRIAFELDGRALVVQVRRAHLEEDAGKLIHSPDARASLVDLNRAGTPLLEIVSEPDMRSGAEARAYLEEVRRVLRYVGASECNMEEGSMRCEPNISVRARGADGLGTKTEVKNLNSLRAVEEAIDYEAARQAALVASGGRVLQETMLWDPARRETRPMRSKEEEQDYRYFPEPDLPPVGLGAGWVERARRSVGELPSARRRRYVGEHGLSEYDAGVLAAEKTVGDYFDEVVELGVEPKQAANWVTQDLLRVMGERKLSVREVGVTPGALAELVELIAGRVIDRTAAREKVFPSMVETGRSPREIVEAEGLAMVSDAIELEAIVRRVIGENPKPLADVAKNPRAATKYIGLVRSATGGAADVGVVKNLVKRVVREKTGLEVDI